MASFGHPAFELLSPWLPELNEADRPDPARLNAIVERMSSLRPVASGGAFIRFESGTSSRKQKALDYERSIHDTGRVPMRPHDWHDAFNALCWIAWPVLKSEINALHARDGRGRAPSSGAGGNARPLTGTAARRGSLRDALTLIDESGVIVLSADPELSALLLAKRWKALFFERRERVASSMRFLVCGHALFDKLRAPYRSIAARALIVDAPDVIVGESIERQRRYANAAAASMMLSGATASTTTGRAPPPTVAFPVCAIPGWWPGNDRAEFYDDATVFRPASASIESDNRSTDAQSACAPASVNSATEP